MDLRCAITARATHLGCPCIQWDIISAKMVSPDVKSDEEDTREGNEGLEGRERQFRSAVARLVFIVVLSEFFNSGGREGSGNDTCPALPSPLY